MAVVVSGIKPSGRIHLGNYVGMLRPGLALTDEHEVFHFVADLHALTTLPEGERLRERAFDAAAVLLAVGFEPGRAVVFRQSDVPEILELAWVLSCLTNLGTLERAHAYKSAVEAGEPVNHGLFSYPVLMASDILAPGGELVPVGGDQKQHLEITRDLARRFNHHYGDLLAVPEPLLPDDADSLPGVDGRKMSKSYDNTIPLMASPDEIRDRVAGIVTDSTPRDAPKDPDTSAVYAVFTHFASREEAGRMADDLREGAIGWKEAKDRLADVLVRELTPLRRRWEELRENRDRVEEVLAAGADRVRKRARTVLADVRARVGLPSPPSLRPVEPVG